MAKEIFEIRNFNLGTYTTQSDVDIPQEAASYSLDVDPLNREGRLIGRPEDSTKVSGINGSAFQIINRPAPNDETQDVVYFDPSDNKIKVISDFYGTPSTGTTSSALDDSTDVTMTKSNQEVHIGLGKNQEPKWAGYVKKQFGIEYSSIQIEDAELKAPELWQAMKEHLEDDTYLYAIGGGLLGSAVDANSAYHTSGWTANDVFPNLSDSKYIYKFDKATGELVYKSEVFGDIASICLFDNKQEYGSGDNSYLWVFDRAGTTVSGSARIFGTVHKVDRETFKIVQTNPITNVNTPDGSIDSTGYSGDAKDFFWNGQYIVTDMMTNGEYIWITIAEYDYNPALPDSVSIIWNAPIPIVDGDITISPRMPFLGTNSGTGDSSKGAWVDGSNNNVYVSMRIAQNGLFYSNDGSYISLLCKISHMGNDNRFLLTTGGSNNQLSYNSGSDKGNYMLFKIYNNQTQDSQDDFINNKPLFYTTNTTLTATNRNSYVYSNGSVVYINRSSEDNLSVDKFIQASINSLSFGGNIDDAKEYTNTYADFNNNVPHLTISSINDDILYLFNSPGLYAYGNKLIGHLYTIDKSADNTLQTLSIPEVQIHIDGTADYSNTNNTIFYKVSFLYDSFQESPLSERIASNIMMDPSAGRVSININGTVNKRITDINIYTADNSYVLPSETDGYKGFRSYSKEPNGFYRLVKQIKLDETWSSYTENSASSLIGKTKSIIDEAKTYGSYESLNGVSETLEDTGVNYSISTVMNSSNYVAGCSHASVENADNYIFKSMPFMYDQFDWSENYLRIDNLPTAIAGFGGRIWVFDSNNTYKVNPEQFYIEDTFEGSGCIGSEAVSTSEFGLCYADKNNIYLHNGSAPQPIGTRILRSDNNTGYQELLDEAVFKPKILFDGQRKAYIVYVTATKAWVFSVIHNRWDLWSANECKGGFSGKAGEIFYSDGSNLIAQSGGTDNKSFEFISKKISIGHDTQPKKFYRLDIGYRGTKPTNVAYSTEGSAYTDNVPTGTGNRVSVTFSGLKKNDMQVKVEGDPDSQVESIGVVFRRFYKLIDVGATIVETASE